MAYFHAFFHLVHCLLPCFHLHLLKVFRTELQCYLPRKAFLHPSSRSTMSSTFLPESIISFQCLSYSICYILLSWISPLSYFIQGPVLRFPPTCLNCILDFKDLSCLGSSWISTITVKRSVFMVKLTWVGLERLSKFLVPWQAGFPGRSTVNMCRTLNEKHSADSNEKNG